MAHSPKHRILRKAEVSHRVGLSDSRIDWLEARGRFPRRVPLSSRSVGWLEHEVEGWIAERIAMREDVAAEAEARQKRNPYQWFTEPPSAA